MKEFILKQQLPNHEEALRRAEESLEKVEQPATNCPHLLKILPDQLDLTFVKSINRGWMLSNPVHALHLESQLDPAWLRSSDQPPVLYGEEQERLMALLTEGLSESWHPLMEQQPHQQQQPPQTDTSNALNITSQAASDATAEPAVNIATRSKVNTDRFRAIQSQEEHIRSIRLLLTKRSKKRRDFSLWPLEPVPILTMQQEEEWDSELQQARTRANMWLQFYRLARQAMHHSTTKMSMMLFGEVTPTERTCETCQQQHQSDDDELMQCLECPFVGCSPSWMTPNSKEHMLEHLFVSNHGFAVTCGPQAKIYCFKCGDFVDHEVFDVERERVDLAEKLPWMAWKEHPLQRSFDALQFMRVVDQGIFWRGMVATYPPLVPSEHVQAARLSRWRQILCGGDQLALPESASEDVKAFVLKQSEKPESIRSKIPTPVGMYNLSNTCYMSAVLQCLIHCIPFQQYFLRDVGHDHSTCSVYRNKGYVRGASSKGSGGVCLACEVDRLLLRYCESAFGQSICPLLDIDPRSTLSNAAPSCQSGVPIEKGEPLVTPDILVASWKCLNHLAGYDQRDAHEFLHGFLDIVGKHAHSFRNRVYDAVHAAVPSHVDPPKRVGDQDIVKRLFEGTLRSVLICRKCGSKRAQSEPFMSISLPLSKEVHQQQSPGGSTPRGFHGPLSVERCLHQFTMPEALSDPVDCPACGEKTPTTKQHVVSKLPRVLCLHLKRFDAAHNRKIEDYVSFPAKGLNMGPYLPHWCEVSPAPTKENQTTVTPDILYNLVGTVNHFGNLQSGHYVANVKVDDIWYHCNDAHVSFASGGAPGNGETQVIGSDGAYLLFYSRS